MDRFAVFPLFKEMLNATLNDHHRMGHSFVWRACPNEVRSGTHCFRRNHGSAPHYPLLFSIRTIQLIVLKSIGDDKSHK